MEGLDWVKDIPDAQLAATCRAIRRWYPEHNGDGIKKAFQALQDSGKLRGPAGTLKPYVSLVTPGGMFLGIEPDGYVHS